MISGKIHVLGNHINTDIIHPPKYFSLNQERVKSGFMKGMDARFTERFKAGDIIIAGTNFGCGSSRETSIYTMLYNNVGAIIAVSFARIFYRNAINNGLLVFEFAEPTDYNSIKDYADAKIDLEKSILCIQDNKFPLLGLSPSFRHSQFFSSLPNKF